MSGMDWAKDTIQGIEVLAALGYLLELVIKWFRNRTRHRRRVPWRWVFVIVGLALSAVALFVQPVQWRLVVAVGIVFSGLAVAYLDQRAGTAAVQVLEPTSPERKEPSAAPASPVPPVDPSPVDPPEERIFTDATPEELTGFYTDHMSIVAARLAEPHIGKWLKVSGPLGNVGVEHERIGSQVTFAYRPDRAKVYMWFKDTTQVARLSVMERDHEIVVIGRIDRIEGDHVQLEDCELGSPEPASGRDMPASQIVLPVVPLKPEDIWRRFEGRTDSQVQAEVRPLLGQLREVSGLVYDVGAISDGTSLVSVEGSDEWDGHLVHTRFDQSWSERTSALQKGERITVRGELVEVSRINMKLERCQLVKPEDGK